MRRLPEGYFWRNWKYIAPIAGRIWDDLLAQERDEFLAYLQTGPSEDFRFPPEKSHYNEIAYSAPWLMALERENCALDKTSQLLIQRAQAHPEWEPPEERSAQSFSVRHFRETESKPDQLLSIPVADILRVSTELENASQFSSQYMAPFHGLVQSKPIRAYRALSLAARSQDYPVAYWQGFLNRLPDTAETKLLLSTIESILRMPKANFDTLNRQIGAFSEKYLPGLFTLDAERTAITWDSIFERLVAIEVDTQPSEDAAEHGIRGTLLNSALGQHIQLLLTLYTKEVLSADKEHKRELLKKLNRVFTASNTSRRMLVNLGISHLLWFNHYFSKWTKENLVPRLLSSDPDNEHAWNGFMFLRYTMPPSIFKMVKEDFIRVFQRQSQWRWGKNLSATLHSHFLHYCNGRGRDGKYLTAEEARQVLHLTDDNGRVNVLHRLHEGGDWQSFQKKFLTTIWPKELKYRNPRVTSALIRLALENDSDFADVVRTILPFMTHVTHAEPDFYSSKASIYKLAERYPFEVLSLIDAAIQDQTAMAFSQFFELLDTIERTAPKLREAPAIDASPTIPGNDRP